MYYQESKMPASNNLNNSFNSMVSDLNRIFGPGATYPPSHTDEGIIRDYWCDTVSMQSPHDAPCIGPNALFQDLITRAGTNGGTFKGLNFSPTQPVSCTVLGNAGVVTGVGNFTDNDNDRDQPPTIKFTFHYDLVGGVWKVRIASSTRN